MKLGGKTIEPPKPEMIVLPRGENNEDSLVFYAQAVLNFEEFDKLCPTPLPSKKVFPGGKVVDDTENPEFVSRIQAHFEKRYHWLVLKSLQATPDLVWETVDMQNPDTWKNYETELEAGFTRAEVMTLQQGVMGANSMSAERQDQARRLFRRTPAQA